MGVFCGLGFLLGRDEKQTQSDGNRSEKSVKEGFVVRPNLGLCHGANGQKINCRIAKIGFFLQFWVQHK
jgi:hypothetical protein